MAERAPLTGPIVPPAMQAFFDAVRTVTQTMSTKAAIKASGGSVGYTLMCGPIYGVDSDGRRLGFCKGSIRRPADRDGIERIIRAYSTAVAAGAEIPLNESAADRASEVRNFVTELDLKVLMTVELLRMLTDFIAEFVAEDVARATDLWKHHGYPMTADALSALGEPVRAVLAEGGWLWTPAPGESSQSSFNTEVEVNPKVSVVQVVIATTTACERAGTVLPDARTDRHIRLLQMLTATAYGAVVSKVCAQYYPKLLKSQRECAVLHSTGPNAPVPDKDGKVNFGAHVYMSGIRVTEGDDFEGAHRLLNDIAATIVEALPQHPALAAGVDHGLYSGGGGMRMPWACKPIKCETCGGKPDHRAELACARCGSLGWVSSGRWYAPTLMLDAVGRGVSPRAASLLKDRMWALRVCIATTMPGKDVTECDWHAHPTRHKRKTGCAGQLPSSPKKRRQVIRDATKAGVDAKNDPHGLANIVATFNALEDSGGLRRSNTVTVVDGRLAAAQAGAGELLATVFACPRLARIRIAGMSVQHRTSDPTSPIVSVTLWPERANEGARLCGNRRIKSNRFVNGVAGAMELHSSACVHYVINPAEPSITQRCRNVKVDPETRVSGKPCNELGGITVPLTLPAKAAVGLTVEEVLAAEEQIRDEVRRWLWEAADSKRMAERMLTNEEYLKGFERPLGSRRKVHRVGDPIGPTADFGERLAARIADRRKK